ncbi:tRNA uridine-5-carboxymethylaminomethyl(34) synthesis GTPase MnmE [Porcipelethomonas sp.]|uniref:tRNA uridine-5-carboxymethylaminomethyl(34) synthesis GTPase MnmE n=1 Tax=Porcipelethomonas sp. TaxID=2981675 RepID=UPI003EF6DF70
MSTIAAIATPDAPGGISVIRISGEKALDIADRIFKNFAGKRPSDMDGYTCAYGNIIYNNEIVDDVVLTVFRNPKSYTGEDTVEISCHGGRYITKKILRIIYNSGAVPAQPGEFTKRAFLNGKMSLTQAEAVMDVISSSGECQLRYANALKEGAVFRRVDGIKEKLVNILADLAAWADFPEEDVPEVSPEVLGAQIDRVVKDLTKTSETYDHGRIIRDGINTVIAGRPNVGKSTLMNCLSGFQRSIVTDIAGTTRDTIEESVRLGSLTLRLSDTAGIRETDDIIESMGVDIAYKKIDEADLILAVFDGTAELEKKDFELISRLNDKNCVAVINKTDGESNINKEYIYNNFKHIVEISAKNEEGIEKLQNILEDMFLHDESEADQGIIANERQKNCIDKALADVIQAKEILGNGEMLDAVTVVLDSALDSLMELTGEKSSEKIIDDVFSRFCVGK